MRMHVAIVTRCFPKGPDCIDGGVAGVTKYLVDGFSKCRNIKLTVLVPQSGIKGTVCEQWTNLDVYRIGKKGLWHFLPVTMYDILSGSRRIRSFLRKLNPDIVHFQGATFLAAGCKLPSVLTIHGIAEKDALWDSRRGILRWPKWLLLKLTEEYGRRRISYVILISEYVRQFLPKRNRNRKTWLIENPVADSYFDVEWAFEPGRVFCCSRIRPLKNIVGMIKAFAHVVERFAHSQLRIAGTPEPAYLEACREQAKADGISDRVHFLGNIGIKDVQRELSRANCLVLPSFQENAPLTIEEAMAVGVPVIGARVGGIPGMVEDGKTGLLVDPYNARDIATAVCMVLSDKALAASMSRHAKDLAKRRFAASLVCRQTLEVYDEILSHEH